MSHIDIQLEVMSGSWILKSVFQEKFRLEIFIWDWTALYDILNDEAKERHRRWKQDGGRQRLPGED